MKQKRYIEMLNLFKINSKTFTLFIKKLTFFT